MAKRTEATVWRPHEKPQGRHRDAGEGIARSQTRYECEGRGARRVWHCARDRPPVRHLHLPGPRARVPRVGGGYRPQAPPWRAALTPPGTWAAMGALVALPTENSRGSPTQEMLEFAPLYLELKPERLHNAAMQLRAVDSKARGSALCCFTSHAPNCDGFLNYRARQLQWLVLRRPDDEEALFLDRRVRSDRRP